jgi:hypothetical protein
MGQRFIITESERNQIRGLYEQPTMNTASGTYKTTTVPEEDPLDFRNWDFYKKSHDTFTNEQVHSILGWASFAADFIPEIGPLIGAGIGTVDAFRYYQEGDTKMACVMLVLTSLPLMGQGISKIPGVKELGKNGLNILAKKLGSAAAKYTTTEVKLIKGINLNKEIIHKEAEGLFKRTLNSVSNKTGAGVFNKTAAKVANIADKTVYKGINQGINKGVEKTSGGVYDFLNAY